MRHRRSGRRRAAWFALVLAGPPAAGLAQDAGPAAPEPPLFQPGAAQFGAWSLTPQLGVAAGYNDNLRLQSSARIASPFVAVLPGVALARASADSSLGLEWRSEWTRFADSRDDDTLNSQVSASGLGLAGAHTAFTWNLALQDWHDSIGLAAADQVAQTPDHFRAAAFGAVLRHDADDAGTQRLELEPTLSAKRYLNHRDVTFETDADTASLVGRAFWLVAPARRFGPELRVVRTRYPHSDEDLSNVDLHALATMKWDAGGAFSGTASAGMQHRGFDGARRDYDGVAWEADGLWQLGPRTQASFATSRGAGEAPGEGVDEVVSRRASVGIGHDWSARWHGAVSASTTVDHYVNSPLSRDDRVQAIDLAVRADLSRTWRVSLSCGWTKRRSEIGVFDFERRLGSIELSAAI